MYFYENGKCISLNDMHKSNDNVNFDQVSQNLNRLCKGNCIQFKATKPVSGGRYASGQSKCQVCEIFLTAQGVVDNIRCKCCNFRVRNKPRNSLFKAKYNEKMRNANNSWIKKETEDENIIDEIIETKKSTPLYEEVDNSVKTYYEFKEFLSSKMELQANYQLVMLKELLEYGKLHKGEIAESLAYFNNKDSSDINSVKYYLNVPVYDVLLDHGFVTMNFHDQIPYYTINVILTDYQKLELSDYLINNIAKYNEEHNIPENEYPNANNADNVDWDNHIELLINQKSQDQTNENIQQAEEENILNEEKFQDNTKKESKREFKSCSRCNQIKIPLWDSRSLCRDCVEEKERETKEERSRSKWMKRLLGISSVNTSITKESMNESSLIKQESEKMRNDNMVVKVCPHCNTTISGVLNSSELNNQIEEKFGFRQRYPNDPKSKTPQSYCRDCRSSQNIEEENEEIDINSHIESQDFKSVKIFESNNDSISIKHCKVISTEIIQKDQNLTNDEIVGIFGVGNMGRIRYSSKNNVIILCDIRSGHYDNKLDKDFQIIYYTGEGQKGDQTLTGENQRVVNSENTPMFYFIEVPQEPGQRRRGALDNIYKFVGQVTYTKHAFKTENDINGTPRQVIKFLLEVKE